MAQIHPDFYTIQHLHQPATEGELILLDFLQKNLNMEFEIYYHPFINGDRPNIVILKKGCGRSDEAHQSSPVPRSVHGAKSQSDHTSSQLNPKREST